MMESGRRVAVSLIVAAVLGTVGWVWAIQADVTTNSSAVGRLVPAVATTDDEVHEVKTDIAVIKERLTSQSASLDSMSGKLDVLLYETRRSNGH